MPFLLEEFHLLVPWTFQIAAWTAPDNPSTEEVFIAPAPACFHCQTYVLISAENEEWPSY